MTTPLADGVEETTVAIQPRSVGAMPARRSINLPMWQSPVPDSLAPSDVTVRQVPTNVIVDLQQHMSRAIWRPAPGRKLGFLVEHQDELLAILFLASPVVNLGARDKALGLSADPSERGNELRHYMDLSVCVGAQPAAWYWNLGKLAAMLATTLTDEIEARYGDRIVGITTTSLWGRGSQYNRVYRFLGYTKGYGHEHIPDVEYHQMMRWLRTNSIPVPSSRFGEGSNPRMRRISAYRKASGDAVVTLRHGNLRGVYYSPAVPTSTRQEVVSRWLERWGQPRFDRLRDQPSPYVSGYEVKP